MDEHNAIGAKRVVSYIFLILSVLVWAGAWSFPVVAEEWMQLTLCSSGLCGLITQAYSSALFKAAVLLVLLAVVTKEFLVRDDARKLKLNSAMFLLGIAVTAIFFIGLSLPLLSAEAV